jgi:hypothetical protein
VPFFKPLDPGPGLGKKIRIRVRDEQAGSYFRELRNNFLGLKILKFFDADPGWTKFGSGMEKIWIRDKHLGSTTLIEITGIFTKQNVNS